MHKHHDNKEIKRRLAIIAGHLSNVQKMVDDERYCIDILNQSLAVQRALREVDSLLLDRHLHSCVVDALRGKGKSQQDSIHELITIFKRAN